MLIVLKSTAFTDGENDLVRDTLAMENTSNVESMAGKTFLWTSFSFSKGLVA